MAATTVSTTTTTTASAGLVRAGAAAGVVGAAATTAIAALARGAGVALEVGGQQIPLAGFAQMTLLCTAIGVLIAAGLRRWGATPRRTFVAVTLVLTGLSFVPDLTADATAMTRLTLVVTHVVAAALVIPTLARPLRRRCP